MSKLLDRIDSEKNTIFMQNCSVDTLSGCSRIHFHAQDVWCSRRCSECDIYNSPIAIAARVKALYLTMVESVYRKYETIPCGTKVRNVRNAIIGLQRTKTSSKDPVVRTIPTLRRNSWKKIRRSSISNLPEATIFFLRCNYNMGSNITIK